MEWKISQGLVPYEEALTQMQARVAALQAGTADELVWLLEHPPLYTAGTSAKGEDLLETRGFPVYQTGRGGQYTYHGPGQRVVYLMLDLNQRGRDLRAYVQQLERWIILTLAQFGIEGLIREGRVGVWVEKETGFRVAPKLREPLAAGISEAKGAKSPFQKEAKIAALGVRVQKWVSSHGIALNVHPDLSHYAGIVPCGIREFGVTSMHTLGCTATMAEVDAVLKEKFAEVFGNDTPSYTTAETQPLSKREAHAQRHRH